MAAPWKMATAIFSFGCKKLMSYPNNITNIAIFVYRSSTA